MNLAKVILITGASSGIGLATATYLHKQGYRVFGTKLPHENPPQVDFHYLELDVTHDESVKNCVQTVLKTAGRLDVLVNNAGATLVGAVEETSLEEARWQMEVNFWGMVRLTQAVLPYMREQGQGTIINMSSLLGLYGTPFSPFYAASKHAVEGFTKSLRYEVATFGILVAMIEPGFVKTDLMQHGRATQNNLPVYAQMKTNLLKVGEQNLAQGFSPQIIAETVQEIIEDPHPRLSYPLFIDSLSRITSRLPESLRERVLHYLMGIYNPLPDLPYLGAMGLVGVGLAVYLRRLTKSSASR